MRKIANRINIVYLIVGIIAVITYPYLREYSLTVFMPRYMIFHWYLLFPMLFFAIGYFMLTMSLAKTAVQIPTAWKLVLLYLLYWIIGVYLMVSIITCIHCYIPFLPSVIADRILYCMAMIYEDYLLAFTIIGGLYFMAIS